MRKAAFVEPMLLLRTAGLWGCGKISRRRMLGGGNLI